MKTMDSELFSTFLGQKPAIDTSSEGYCILFDMEDSTAMKTLHADWKDRFVFFYEAFCSFVDRICRQQNFSHEPILKFLGDAAMAYIPCNKDEGSRSQAILGAVQEFRNFLASVHHVLGIRVRTVVTFLDHIQLVDIPRGACGTRDALGQGLDFTFRLEKFGSGDSICLNGMFREQLGPLGGDCLRGYEMLPCRRLVKGWSAPQAFWLARPRIISSNVPEGGISLRTGRAALRPSALAVF